MRTTLIHRRLAAATLAYAALAAGVFCRDLQAAESQAAAETPKQVYQEKCSACHNAFDPAEQAMTLSEWRSTVNRMLYRHGASDEISPDQTKTILTYLATFAVPDSNLSQPPGALRRRIDNSDVWSGAPIYSRDYVFGADAGLAGSLSPVSKAIAWKVLSVDGEQGLALRALPDRQGPDVLLMPPPPAQGGIRIEAEFKQPRLPGVTLKPLTFGLAFASAQGTGEAAAQYDVACYDAKRDAITLVQTSGTQSVVIASAQIPGDQLAGDKANTWHTLRVDAAGNRVKVWLDYSKVLDTMLPTSAGSPAAGVWTNSRASVRSLSIDVYANSLQTPDGVRN